MKSTFLKVLEKVQKDTPKEPGCYLMKDHEGKIFYIGKAKNLKNRLKSYFGQSDRRLFVQFLEEILSDIEIIVVKKDLEALLLERELIKKHNPRFNIMLKDDKNYLLLKIKKITNNNRKKDLYPRLELVRKIKKDKAQYFGPYPSAQRLRTTVELINKYFLLRTCKDNEIENRQRPCIQYQINRCLAPCVYDILNYEQEMENVISFLKGDFGNLKKRLAERMDDFAKNEEFEKAAKARDQIAAIETSLETQALMDVQGQKNQDVIGISQNGANIEIVQMLVRNGIWHESHNFSLQDQHFPKEEILQRFLEENYIKKELIPDEILLPLDITEELTGFKEWLNKEKGKKIKIFVPKKGKNLELIGMAQRNAEIALQETAKKASSAELALDELKELLKLSFIPKRIECIDISILQGKNPKGSCVVFIDGNPEKKLYRTYNIKTVQGMNDFAMIEEVVNRRIKRAIKENSMPDLLLIDGGKGQLSAALKALDNLGVLLSKDYFFIAGIAKKRAHKNTDERLYLPDKDEPLALMPHTFSRYLIEQLRDEAHRFAITAHRGARKKEFFTKNKK